MAAVSDEARQFIDRYIDSLETLEVLLLLQRSPERTWRAAEVASSLQLGDVVADRSLSKLCGKSLLDVRLGSDLFYSFAPRLPHLRQGAQELARAYASNRLAVLKLVSGRARAPVRDFAEAFRITHKDEDDSDG